MACNQCVFVYLISTARPWNWVVFLLIFIVQICTESKQCQWLKSIQLRIQLNLQWFIGWETLSSNATEGSLAFEWTPSTLDSLNIASDEDENRNQSLIKTQQSIFNAKLNVFTFRTNGRTDGRMLCSHLPMGINLPIFQNIFFVADRKFIPKKAAWPMWCAGITRWTRHCSTTWLIKSKKRITAVSGGK